MRCPVDNETLVMADRGGVEIDYCPKCRGVWLDRGELDKIIERSAGAHDAPPPPRPVSQPLYQPEPQRAAPSRPAPQGYADQDRPRRRDDDDDDYRGGHKKKRRESFLGELFDF